MIRLILDQCLPRRAAAELREAGLLVEHVGELGMTGAEDAEILEKAVIDGLTVVTLDSDFGTIIAARRLAAPSVVFIRMGHINVKATSELLLRVLPEVEGDLARGAIVTVSARGIRVRRLPIGSQSE